MEEYARILNYAIPGFILLIAVEHGASYWMQIKVNRLFDIISSLSSGITNVVKDILGLSIVIISYAWMFDHLAITQIKGTWALYLAAFIGLDLAGYWTHRLSHEINIFWNRHIIHHSSEEYNLACALRQSVSEIFAIFTIFFLPMALIGVPPSVVAIVGPLHLFAQFWYHTRLIGKMGWLEYIIVTPSHHRVHHAVNPEYMDRNYSQIFIIWDKIFGTFQAELPHVEPVYGVTRPVSTWNPWLINYSHLWLLIKDAWHTASWWDKIRIWWMPTGWRPEDVATKYKLTYDHNIYERPKYHTEGSMFLNIWSTFQLIATLAFMMFLFNNIGQVGGKAMLVYGALLFVSIYAYTSVMDGDKGAIVAELIKVCIGSYLFYNWNWHWYNLGIVGSTIVMAYFVLSLVLTLYFTLVDRPHEVFSTLNGVSRV
jgi:alkylglycerol monooxygenase